MISFHDINDVTKIRSVLNRSDLLVRVNPINEDSEYEIKEVITRGADIVMLPMFKTPQEVTSFIKYV